MGRVIRDGRLEIRLRPVTVGVMPIAVRVLVYSGRRPAAGVVFAGAKLYVRGIFEIGADEHIVVIHLMRYAVAQGAIVHRAQPFCIPLRRQTALF